MNILICDDQRAFCGEVEEALLRYARQKKLKVDIEVFFRGNALISYLQNHPETDILFLDIRLPDRDGVEIGSCIRDVLDNQKLILVYISALEQYAMQLFRNRPFDFLLKPLEAGEIERLMDRILRVTGKGKTCFAYQTRSGVSRVPYREILYFQSLGRKIQIMTEKGPRFFYGKLGELAGSLPEDQFLVIHKSFIVNFTFVREYTQSQVHLTNGDTLPISKSRQSQVRRKIMEAAIWKWPGPPRPFMADTVYSLICCWIWPGWHC